MAKKKKKNPNYVPWIAGAIGAGLLGYFAVRVMRGKQEQQAVASLPQAQTFQQRIQDFRSQYQQPTQPAGFLGLGGAGTLQRDRNGIPIVPLPGESAQRTQQLRAMSANSWRPPGMDPPGAAPQTVAATPDTFVGESFGGEMGDGGFGGEKF